MKLEVLISCLQQKDTAIVDRTNITTDTLIINQTDFVKVKLIQNGRQTVRQFSTLERGLSKSRNMALKYASGDICLICDDDEILTDNYESIILKAFQKLPDAAVIAFNIENKVTRLRPVIQRIGRLRALKLASCQLAVKKNAVCAVDIKFDENMGAGSGNGCGEENKFLWDCIRRNLKIYYVPETIGQVGCGPSTWFFGYNRQFFYQRGAATRHIMGLFPAVFYGLYYLAAKYKQYSRDITLFLAARSLIQGIYKNPIQHAEMPKGKK